MLKVKGIKGFFKSGKVQEPALSVFFCVFMLKPTMDSGVREALKTEREGLAE